MQQQRTLLLAAVCGSLCLHLHAQQTHKTIDPDEGTLASVRPKIPEPMVFDLIRPLGAKRGEFEVNSLFRMTPFQTGHRRLQWAPEVEYAFLDGYGIEFELPMENQEVESYKGAIQGTLPGPLPSKFIHGWQALAEVSGFDRSHHKINMLYLAGVRWHPKWSVFTMTGAERESIDRTSYAFLGNYTVFYHKSRTVTYGFETNWKGEGESGRGALLMPQIQIRKTRINLQVGAGWRWHAGQGGALQIGWRLSREF